MSGNEQMVHASKFMALILRHKPEVIGITLDPEGWADIDDLVAKSNGKLTRDLIDRAVAENNKKRFVVSEDGKRIRASQGHSVEVDLGLVPVKPPDVLYHGTHSGVSNCVIIDVLSCRWQSFFSPRIPIFVV